MKSDSFEGGITRRRFVTGGALVFTSGLLSATRGAARQAPASAERPTSQLIEDLVAANRILADQGIVDGYGHVSARHDRDPNRYLLSRSKAPELVTAEDILEFDLGSRPVPAGRRSLYRERFIHGEIYKARPDVQAVVHHHSPALIPFGVSTVPLRPIYHMSAFIGQGIPIFEIRDVSGEATNLLVDSGERGRALAQTLENRAALLMRGHGAVVVGASLSHAVGRCIYLTLNAQLQAQAMALGGHINYLTPEEARAIVEERVEDGFSRAWELWKRKALSE